MQAVPVPLTVHDGREHNNQHCIYGDAWTTSELTSTRQATVLPENDNEQQNQLTSEKYDRLLGLYLIKCNVVCAL